MTALTTVPTFTPAGLTFDEPTHRYTLDGRELLSVTTALKAAGFIDTFWFTADDTARGTRVHAAINLLHTDPSSVAVDDDVEIAPFLTAYRTFLADSAFRVDASEELLGDRLMMCAGTLDLRGQFTTGPRYAPDVVDIVDVKTGAVPDWVGYQVAGYVRMLPPSVARRARRWVLNLRANGTYALDPLTKKTDERVFMAALTIAHAKRGWL